MEYNSAPGVQVKSEIRKRDVSCADVWLCNNRRKKKTQNEDFKKCFISVLYLSAVIRSFFGYENVVCMTFLDAGIGDFYKFCFL